MRCCGILFLFIFASCSVSKKITKSANKLLLSDSALLHAHVGISIFEPATGKYWYNHNGDKYFVPASNTKIPTCYAAMKYLGDSIIGLQYKRTGDYYIFKGTGDPSFLHPDFTYQPVFHFFKTIGGRYSFDPSNFREEALGNGWAWNDYNDDYMAERSAMPVYGNVMEVKINNAGLLSYPTYFTAPKYKDPNAVYAQTEIIDSDKNEVVREKFNNGFYRIRSNRKAYRTTIPFITSKDLVINLLYDTLGSYYKTLLKPELVGVENVWNKISTQPTDSVLKPMMHRSDNFFAEQSLLMVSNSKLGYMQDEGIINFIKQHDFAGIPQMPRWVDGSGLSRYNMFTPQSLVWILNKMKTEFGLERIKNIFATGGEGTISNYYKNMQGFIFAKTGTLSGHAALSGFLYTRKNRLLIFSILTSGWQGSATPVRKAVEKFLSSIREQY
jgi:D-alanyl-D-alanine carboxypeptidase/D-alanyl-D-alanine-endopeptidase (penicillin-binding protein 4)